MWRRKAPPDTLQDGCSCIPGDRERPQEYEGRRSQERRGRSREPSHRKKSNVALGPNFSFLTALVMIFLPIRDPEQQEKARQQARKRRTHEDQNLGRRQSSARHQNPRRTGSGRQESTSGVGRSKSGASRNERRRGDDDGEEAFLSGVTRGDSKKRSGRKREAWRYRPAKSVRSFLNHKKGQRRHSPALDHPDSKGGPSLSPVPWYRRASTRLSVARDPILEEEEGEIPTVPERLTRWPEIRDNRDRCEAWVDDCMRDHPALPPRNSTERAEVHPGVFYFPV